MKCFLLCLGLLAAPLSPTARSQSYFPETGQAAVYQRSLDVSGRLRVLSVSLEPGYEDLSSLAYLRMKQGAKTLSAYASNGGAGDHDIELENPFELAGERRSEATRAVNLVGAGAYFLNLPDIVTAVDGDAVKAKWSMDTLQYRIRRLLADFRPDIILVSRDWGAQGTPSARWEVLMQEIKAIALAGEPGKQKTSAHQNWRVPEVWVDRGDNSGSVLPIGTVHPFFKKSFNAVASEASQAYESLKLQRHMWSRISDDAPVRYTPLIQPTKGAQKSLGKALAPPVSPKLRTLDRLISTFVANVINSSSRIQGNPRTHLRQLASIMDSLDTRIARSHLFTDAERREIMQWKSGLENLRASLLGVTVRYSFSETMITQLQLTSLTVDTVIGTFGKGTTELYFPGKEKGWIVNERLENRLPLELHKEYRLLSPRVLDYDWPQGQYGLDDVTTSHPFLVLVIHRAERREESFLYRITEPMHFVPRFSIEVLTPIVRAVPQEHVVVRLTNHSRDGVKDVLHVDDSSASSKKVGFWLRGKESTRTDTLQLTWNQGLPEGTFVLPIKIGSQEVARSAVRNFTASIDTSLRVCLLSGLSHGSTSEALRRLGVQWTYVPISQFAKASLKSFDVLLVDQRALSFVESYSDMKGVLDSFAEGGGRVVILSQDANVWNEHPVVRDLNLQRATAYDEMTEVRTDTLHSVLARPNRITPDDWKDWIDARALNSISGTALSNAEVPVRATAGDVALVATWRKGKGRVTYVNLALGPQLLNVHAGAFRLLANLLAY